MKQYKKTLFGSMLAFFVGTSCCWLSSLAIWLGGASSFAVFIHFIENTQILFLGLGVLLLLATIILLLK